MSESVKIIIDAEDKATKKLNEVTRNVEASVKRIKTTGEQTKKSAEFAGAFANALGGSQFGAFASQLAQVTEKTSQFAEVSKLGGAGALAFKAGLVGMVGVIGFQFGNAIGNAIFQTDKWKQKLAEAGEESKKLGQRAVAAMNANRGMVDRETSLLDKDGQKAAREKELQDVRESAGVHIRKMRELKKEAESWGVAWLIGGRQSEEIKNELQQAEAYIESFRQRAEQLESQVSIRAQAIEAKEIEKLIKADKERIALQYVELQHGREIARILELQKKGVDTKAAAEIVAHEKRLEMMQRETQDLQATESRTLTRSPTNQDWQKRIDMLTNDLQAQESGTLARSPRLQRVPQDSPATPPPDVTQKLESILDRMTKSFGEEIAKGFREQPKIVLEGLQ